MNCGGLPRLDRTSNNPLNADEVHFDAASNMEVFASLPLVLKYESGQRHQFGLGPWSNRRLVSQSARTRTTDRAATEITNVNHRSEGNSLQATGRVPPWRYAPIIRVEPHRGHGLPVTNRNGQTGMYGRWYSTTEYANAKYRHATPPRAQSHATTFRPSVRIISPPKPAV
jgi:hypothetical protein